MTPVEKTDLFKKAYAADKDQRDPLSRFRSAFHFPKKNGQKVTYFCGNSLGLQPKETQSYIEQELKDWQDYGVDGHFEAKNPWYDYHKMFQQQVGDLVGGKTHEVVVMNTLTVNLHLMMVSFYRPTKQKFKILMEGGAFPSDQYAVESQVRFHGFDPKEAIIEVHPKEGSHCLTTEQIKEAISEHADSTALVLFSGVQYYTGQLFDMKNITAHAKKYDLTVGFDLAHAAGNVPLELHHWGVDFAVWCTYKYLNSSPGGVSGAFVHERHAQKPDLPRFAGWWGHLSSERFQMKKGFIPEHGADGWQLSNAQILPMAAHKAALDMLTSAGGMGVLRDKSIKLTGYLEKLLQEILKSYPAFEIITPEDPKARGAQISLLFKDNARHFFESILKENIVVDYREPNVIRVAPTPLYNTYLDVLNFALFLRKHLKENH